MAYKRKVVGGGSYISQRPCSSIALVWVGNAGGLGNKRIIDSCTKVFKSKNILKRPN